MLKGFEGLTTVSDGGVSIIGRWGRRGAEGTGTRVGYWGATD